METEREPGKQRSAFGSALLALFSIVATVVGVGLFGPLVAIVGLGWLVTYTLRRVGVDPPSPPRPRLTLGWLRELWDYLGRLIAWGAPSVPFLAPAITFIAVTWPLAESSSETLRFQEQASQILLVLLIGYVIEAGALRWRKHSVDWLLSLVTVVILLVGETYALVDLATDDPGHADIIAGAMAAGLVAILTAAVQGSAETSDR
ncbi:MAG TPA: hypothetical protein VHR18_00440 [Solirubrobacterales bacterium]|jgi:hypothetical protein|nr:hypothetical protein [Solirubrobacterales bacterium]